MMQFSTLKKKMYNREEIREDYEFYSAHYKCNSNWSLKVISIGGLNDKTMGGTRIYFHVNLFSPVHIMIRSAFYTVK